MGTTWIETYRSFSNNTYWDPDYINYSLLEVINDDRVQPHSFVPIHQHMDMEILGYIVEGTCYHNDNQRNIVDVPAGAVQHMTAGTGLWHIEGNNTDKPNRYMQIWLRPNKMGVAPKYNGYEFTREDKLNNFCLIARQQDAPIIIQSDAVVSAGIFTENHTHSIDPLIKHYLYVVKGTAKVNGNDCVEGDALMYEGEFNVTIENPSECEIILFNLA
jgi:redox-sensitive bicupin YhaK (pirin superfamily)